MRVALGQINPTVGDVAGNTRRILACIDEARRQAADLVVLPELAVIGYPPKDLLLKPAVIEQCTAAVEHIASQCHGVSAIVGYPCKSDKAAGRPLYNAAAVCRDGQIVHRRVKNLLPTYDVFDETRYFEPGARVDVTELNGTKLGISVCEDLWNDAELIDRQLYHDNPIGELAEAGAQLFVNCAASPFVVDKHAFRVELFANAARRHGLPLVYVSQVGGNDDLIFDGNSCVFDADGQLVAQAKDFEEDLLVVDVGDDRSAKPQAARIERAREGMAAVYGALVLGVRDYCRKCGFGSIVLGLSGGIDSAVTACIAAGALGPANVIGVAMPSRYSSDHSKSDAQQLADNLGIAFHQVSIEPAHAAMESILGPLFEGLPADVTEENVQARLRAVILMAFSNKLGALLATTGNKSEMAVGYCTLYGDMAGGLAVLADVPKTMVYRLAEWINEPASPLHAATGVAPIPVASITKPPSAELKPDQTDQDSLPPYDLLDQIIDRYVEREQSVQTIAGETGFDAKLVQRIAMLIDRNEYKRKQAAPVLKITGRAFGSGRRVPIAQRYDPSGAVETG